MLIIERWIYCPKCQKRWKPKDQSITEGDQIVHMCEDASCTKNEEVTK